MATIATPKAEKIVETPEEKAIFSKINWHILPLLLIAYIFAYIDRVNIGFAQLQMKNELHFSDQVFALGAGLFFIGYLIFEVPSNLLLEKIGARKTILRIMVCWGACATAMAWVSAPWQFYALRFLLGAFEAGFFPGCILYFTYWYPPARRGGVLSIFLTATVLAAILVGPLNGWLLKYGQGFLGYQGWQWMFMANGLPCLVIGFLCYFLLSDGPSKAGWLTAEQKATLTALLEKERTHVDSHGYGSLGVLLRDPKVYVLALIYFLHLGAAYAVVFWQPSLIRSWGVTDLFYVGLLAIVPSISGAIGMVLIGRSSDYFNERRWHMVASVALVSAFLGIVAVGGALVPSLILLSIGTIGMSAMTPVFFSFVSEYLPKETAAGGIALISSLGNLAPAVTPSISTWLLTTTGDSAYSLYFIVAMYTLAGIIIATVVRPRKLAAPLAVAA